MAQITQLPLGWVPGSIYDVTHPVGPGGWNRPGDVQLVQFLLNRMVPRLENRRKGKTTEGGVVYPKMTELPLDGHWGQDTEAAIYSYQVYKGIHADGIIEPVDPFVKAQENTKDTMVQLGNANKIRARAIYQLNDDNVQSLGSMWNISDFPSICRAELTASLKYLQKRGGR